MPGAGQRSRRLGRAQRDADDGEPHGKPAPHREVHRHERADAEDDERRQYVAVLAVRGEVRREHRFFSLGFLRGLREVLLRFEFVGFGRERGGPWRPPGTFREDLHLVPRLHHRLELFPRVVTSRFFHDVSPVGSAHVSTREDHGVDAPSAVGRREEELAQGAGRGEELLHRGGFGDELAEGGEALGDRLEARDDVGDGWIFGGGFPVAVSVTAPEVTVDRPVDVVGHEREVLPRLIVHVLEVDLLDRLDRGPALHVHGRPVGMLLRIGRFIISRRRFELGPSAPSAAVSRRERGQAVRGAVRRVRHGLRTA